MEMIDVECPRDRGGCGEIKQVPKGDSWRVDFTCGTCGKIWQVILHNTVNSLRGFVPWNLPHRSDQDQGDQDAHV